MWTQWRDTITCKPKLWEYATYYPRNWKKNKSSSFFIISLYSQLNYVPILYFDILKVKISRKVNLHSVLLFNYLFLWKDQTSKKKRLPKLFYIHFNKKELTAFNYSDDWGKKKSIFIKLIFLENIVTWQNSHVYSRLVTLDAQWTTLLMWHSSHR